MKRTPSKRMDDSLRRILKLNVDSAELPLLKDPSNLVVIASLYRLHDDKMIDKESFTSKAVKSSPGGETSLESWVSA